MNARDILYQALLHRDVRLDGRLFFGVTSTGIYCRSICPARKPKPDNVVFFLDGDTAREAGFRPCKRCRPDSRPGSPAWQGTGATIRRALRLLSDAEAPETIGALAERLGISDRHLRRLFQRHLGRSPFEIAHEHRLATARMQLAATDDRIADIAHAAGFGCLRRFNDAFRKAHGQTPEPMETRS